MNSNREPVRVLVVDDEAAIRSALVKYLAHEGYAAIEAADGTSALEAKSSACRCSPRCANDNSR